MVAPEQRVNLLDRDHDAIDIALAVADLLQDPHHLANVLEVLDLAVQVKRRLSHVVVDLLQLLLPLRVQVLRELLLPRRGFRFQGVLHRLRLEAHRADVMHRRDELNLVLDRHVFFQLVLERLQTRARVHELLVLRLEVLHVQKVEP